MMQAVARRAETFIFPLVVDPVMISKHGDLLLPEKAWDVLRSELFPKACLVTPNMAEASRLVGYDVDSTDKMKDAAEAILGMGPSNVLIKGGGLAGQAVDVLATAGGVQTFVSDHINTQATHGSGCVYSAAITARMALGEDLATAIRTAKAFVTRAISSNPGLGQGIGPLNMMADIHPEAI